MKQRHLSLSVNLAAAAFVLALAIVLAHSPLDNRTFHRAQVLAAFFPDLLWASVTLLGAAAVAYALIAPALVLGRPHWVAATLFTLPLGTIATHLPKNLIASDRPAAVLVGDQIHVIGEMLRHSSFPSGHTVTAFGFATVLVLLSNHRLFAAMVLVPLAALIAFSRLAVGAHWPSDLLAGASLGWLCGICGVWLAGRVAPRFRGWNSKSGIRIMAAVLGADGIYLCLGDVSGYRAVHLLQVSIGIVALVCAAAAFIRPRPGEDPAA